MSNKKIATYHGACIDGTAAATVFKMANPEVDDIYPIKSSADKHIEHVLLDIDENTHVFLLDNVFFLEDIIAKAPAAVTVIDHHISEYERLGHLRAQKKIEYIYDVNKSGATLTWRYFFPGKELPKMLWHIEDGDIWKMEDEAGTDKATSYAFLFMDDLQGMQNVILQDIERVYQKGEALVAYRNRIVDYYMRNAQALHLQVGNYRVKAFNVASVRPVVSLVGNKLSELTKETVVLFKMFGDHVNLSFRSNDKVHGPKAVELAKNLGGGGHTLAAGASIPLREFVDRLDIG